MTTNCGGHILSSSELARMRASVLPPTENNDRDMKRAHLKKLSNDKMKNWPNTLEALRIKKQSFLKEREEANENKRREIDIEEAEYRRKTRLEAIERANKMLFEQTDRMKVLRSQELLSDVLYDRVGQISEKHQQRKQIQDENMEFHKTILQQISDGEKKDKQLQEQLQRKVDEVKISRIEQLEEVRARKRAEKEEEIQIGLSLKRDAQLQLEKEAQSRIEKAQRIKEGNEQTLIANEKLKVVRDQCRALELEEANRREAEMDIIENRKKVRKALEVRKFEKAQLKRQEIIDAATKALADHSSKQEALTLKQFNDAKAKEDKAFTDKEERRAREWNDTVNSRLRQIEAKQERTKAEMLEEEAMVKLFDMQLKEANEKDADKKLRAYEATKACKAEQRETAMRIQKEKAEARIIQMEKERLQLSLRNSDDEKFREICAQEIAKYEAAGKPTYPLYRAMEYKEPDLLAVSGFRV